MIFLSDKTKKWVLMKTRRFKIRSQCEEYVGNWGDSRPDLSRFVSETPKNTKKNSDENQPTNYLYRCGIISTTKIKNKSIKLVWKVKPFNENFWKNAWAIDLVFLRVYLCVFVQEPQALKSKFALSWQKKGK